MTVQASTGTSPAHQPPAPQPDAHQHTDARRRRAGGIGPAASSDRARASLSPSRAADFKTCPLLYRFRTIDRLPERPTADQVRGTLVHSVLERLFDLAANDRDLARAAALVEPCWRELISAQPELADLFPEKERVSPESAEPAQSVEPAQGRSSSGQSPLAGAKATEWPGSEEEFLTSARALLDGYFAVEDPRRLSPAERESLVSVEVDDGRLLLRGYIDRLDVSPAGELRVVDYKTGGAPREAFEARALFQLKFYALVLWRTRGVVPRVLRLLYLKDAQACDFSPDAEELARFERTLIALWSAIAKATNDRDFRPQPGKLCDWCAHQARCPAYGGMPPPFPEPTQDHSDPATPPLG